MDCKLIILICDFYDFLEKIYVIKWNNNSNAFNRINYSTLINIIINILI